MGQAANLKERILSLVTRMNDKGSDVPIKDVRSVYCQRLRREVETYLTVTEFTDWELRSLERIIFNSFAVGCFDEVPFRTTGPEEEPADAPPEPPADDGPEPPDRPEEIPPEFGGEA